MQSKLIFGAIGVGSAAYGALVAWALTADYYEQKIKMTDKVLERYEDKIYDLENGIGSSQEYFLTVGVEPEEAEDPEVVAMRQSLQEAAFGSDAPVERDGFADVSASEVRGLSLDLDDNAVDSSAEVVGTEEDNESSEEHTPPTAEEVSNMSAEETRANLANLISKYAVAEDRDEFVEVAARSVEIQQDEAPFVLDQASYAYDEEGENYSKVTVTYYPQHNILLDEDEDPVIGKRIDEMVGWANLRQFGGASGDPNVVFVRNRRIQTDFEVVQENENDLPIHVKYGMTKDEFRARKAAGYIRLEPEDT